MAMTYKNKLLSLFLFSVKKKLKQNLRTASKGEEIEVPVRYIERTARRRVQDRGRRKDRGECEIERERVEVKTDGRTD